MNSRTLRPCLSLLVVLCSGLAFGDLDLTEYAGAFPDMLDPFTGNWSGQYIEADMDDPEISAQVYALGDAQFRVIFKHRFDVRCPIMHVVDLGAEGGTLEFRNDYFAGRFDGDRFIGENVAEGKRFEMKRVVVESPTLGAKVPRGAIKLFTGKNKDLWRNTPGWDVTDWGTLVVTPGSADLLTRDRYRDVEMHLEFRLPYRPAGRGQDRGNSGVHMMSAYEVQILDSFGLEGVYNECGALYKIAAPKVNVCSPPLQWQTFDIKFIGPRYTKKGEMKSLGRMTVHHNGVLVHHDVELPWRTGGGPLHKNRHPNNHPKQKQSIKLQEHEDYIEFRNIWVVDLEK